MSWFLQMSWYELGDFVVATPMLRAVSMLRGAPVPVFFETAKLRTLYARCPFIEILPEKPEEPPFATTRSPEATRPGESVAEYFFRVHAREQGFTGDMPPAYVDSDTTPRLDRKEASSCIAVFHGCQNEGWLEHKTLPPAVRQHMIDSITHRHVAVVLGSARDEELFWSDLDLAGNGRIQSFLGLSLKDSVSLLSQCDAFISNDTGLYHVAGALGLPGLVLWIRTDFALYRSPASNIVHVRDESGSPQTFIPAIDDFLLRTTPPPSPGISPNNAGSTSARRRPASPPGRRRGTRAGARQ